MENPQEEHGTIVISDEEQPQPFWPPMLCLPRGGRPGRQRGIAYWDAIHAGQRSEYPCFMVNIRDYRGFPRQKQYIPVDFCNYYMWSAEGRWTLTTGNDSREWVVEVERDDDSDYLTLGDGWRRFVQDVGLRPSNACLVQRTNARHRWLFAQQFRGCKFRHVI